MAAVTTNLGVITAYGDAVAAGYTGTKAEWQALMASYATVGQQAVDAKNAAVAAKDTAVAKATEATTAATTATTKANEASASAQSIAQSAAQIQENTDDISQLMSEFTALEYDGAVPSAEQILTDKGVTDSVPYHYRKTGGDGADRLYDQIVGGTVCWNQLVQERPSAVNVSQTSTEWTIKALADPISIVSGHIYAVCVIIASKSTNMAVRIRYPFIQEGLVTGANWYVIGQTNLNALSLQTRSTDGETATATLNTKCAMLIDLTVMFGSTIADYIYSLETAHAGDGVAFFKALFPNDYYPYNAGELVSVSGLSKHKMVGFNQWDEKWEVGRLNGSTGALVSGNGIRSKNYIPVFANTSYYVKGASSLIVCQYDEDKNFISTIIWGDQNKSVLTSADAKYLKVGTYDTYGNVYKNDICINLSDPAKNGTYEPYKAHSYPLDSTLTLRGLFKLDANNNLYADGDTYDADGTVTRRYGVVDLGTLDWKASSTANCFYATAPLYKMVNNMNYICERYKADGFGNGSRGYYGEDGTIRYNYESIQTACEFYVHDSSYTDAIAFKTAMSGVMLVYELATPTTEEADPYQHLQQCDPNGTEEYVSTGIVPVGHNSFYPENLRAKVEQLPWNFASLIAPTESTFTATRNYTTGALFIVDNVLYKVTSNIANGGTITPSTNCTATTLAEIISALA